jgi:hypothetical protein
MTRRLPAKGHMSSKEAQMRKTLCMISLAAAAALATSTVEAAPYVDAPNYAAQAEATVGVIGGTVIGLGISEGWWGSTAAGATLPTTAAGAALGGVAGIGAVAVVDAAVQPCRGFHAMFALNHGACENGHYVGYGPHVRYRRHG